jgi:hypothetical protein
MKLSRQTCGYMYVYVCVFVCTNKKQRLVVSHDRMVYWYLESGEGEW